MLLTSLASYINVLPPTQITTRTSSPTMGNSSNISSTLSLSSTTKAKFGFAPHHKESIKLNPCQILIETFQAFLNNLEMEQISTVLSVNSKLSSSSNLENFIELLTPIAIGLTNELKISSNLMRQLVVALSRSVASPYDAERIAAVGLFSRLVPLKPTDDISCNVMVHLTSALSDPNAIVRGLSVQGMGYVGALNEEDIEKHSQTAITSLLKGIDDTVSDCLINIPLESMRGLSRILQTLPSVKVESFHISLAIRIRPFLGSYSLEIREAAIILFGNLCDSKLSQQDSADASNTTEALQEQLIANLFPLLLHLSEGEVSIIRVSLFMGDKFLRL